MADLIIKSGELSIGMPGGSREGIVRLVIRDGGRRIATVELTPESFALTLLGRVSDATIELYRKHLKQMIG